MGTQRILVLLAIICAVVAPLAHAAASSRRELAELVSSVAFKLDSRNKKEMISSGHASLRVYKKDDGTYTQTMSIELYDAFTKAPRRTTASSRASPAPAGRKRSAGTRAWVAEDQVERLQPDEAVSHEGAELAQAHGVVRRDHPGAVRRVREAVHGAAG
ncbi:hypothetical protein CLOP_g15640 [Closterium sp. NIES-67]|nr:hypothetical protein CLOP_g15640 [Closterium sp. NIES-67]